MIRRTPWAAAALLFALPAAALAQPATFDGVALDVLDPARGELSTLTLNAAGDLRLERRVGAGRGTAERRLLDEEVARLQAAFARARLASLPRLAPGGGPAVTLVATSGGRTWGFAAGVDGVPPRARGLVQGLLALVERHAPRVAGERVRLTGTVFATYGQPLPGHDLALGLDDAGWHGLLSVQNEPFAALLEPVRDRAAVTLAGRVVDWPFGAGTTLAASGLVVEWVEATARRELEVFLPLGAALVPTPFARVRAGECVRVVGARGPFLAVRTEGGLRAHVRRDGLALGRPALPVAHVRGTVAGAGAALSLETTRGAFPVRRAAPPAAVARYWDPLLELVAGEQVTLLGDVDPSGRFVDARALVGRADVALPVRVAPSDSAARDTATAGPSGVLPAGTLLEVRSTPAGGWLAVQRLDRPDAADAFVRAAGVDLAGWGR